MLVRLKYYTTHKVKTLEPLFYKINKRLQKTTICIGLQAEENIYIYLYIYIYIYKHKNILIYHKYFVCFQNLLEGFEKESFENNLNICDKLMCFYI